QTPAQLDLFGLPRTMFSPVFTLVIVACMRESPSAKGKPVAGYWCQARGIVSTGSTVCPTHCPSGDSAIGERPLWPSASAADSIGRGPPKRGGGCTGGGGAESSR